MSKLAPIPLRSQVVPLIVEPPVTEEPIVTLLVIEALIVPLLV